MQRDSLGSSGKAAICLPSIVSYEIEDSYSIKVANFWGISTFSNAGQIV